MMTVDLDEYYSIIIYNISLYFNSRNLNPTESGRCREPETNFVVVIKIRNRVVGIFKIILILYDLGSTIYIKDNSKKYGHDALEYYHIHIIFICMRKYRIWN